MIVFDTSIYIDAFVPAKGKRVLNIRDFINVVLENEIFEEALDIAFETHCRAIDSYFIATTKLANSILISNDRIMVNNAKKYGIKAYYLIEEVDKVLRELREI